MTTTTTFEWDCPECCGGDGPCDGLPHDLFVSGLISGQMDEISPGRNWHINNTLYTGNNTYCLTEISVNCIDGVLTAAGTLAGCVDIVNGLVDVLSPDPMLVSITFTGLPPGCLCPAGTVTISE